MTYKKQGILAASYLAIGLLLAGCGGGDNDVNTPEAARPNTSQQTVQPNGASSSIPTVCGYMAGDKTIQGTVVKVYDGDTITVQDSAGTKHSIRLDSIDAPELAQTYGTFSQESLERSVLNQQVTIAYSKKDQYDRIVGTVFKSNCEYVNKNQVAIGAAWFYKAYQCEIAAPLRIAFAEDQSTASATRSGLWSEASQVNQKHLGFIATAPNQQHLHATANIQRG